MMTRNTEKRVEVACPILDADIKKQINHYLKVMLSDNIKGRVLLKDGTYCRKELVEPYVDSQAAFMEEALNAQRMKPVQREKTFFGRLKDVLGRRVKQRS